MQCIFKKPKRLLFLLQETTETGMLALLYKYDEKYHKAVTTASILRTMIDLQIS